MTKDQDGVEIVEEIRYVNFAHVMISPLDVNLELRQVNMTPHATSTQLQMSPEFAKLLAAMLNEAIDQYEKNNGKVRDLKLTNTSVVQKSYAMAKV